MDIILKNKKRGLKEKEKKRNEDIALYQKRFRNKGNGEGNGSGDERGDGEGIGESGDVDELNIKVIEDIEESNEGNESNVKNFNTVPIFTAVE